LAHAPVTVTKYVVEKATTGTVVSSVSATGQMQAITTVDVKAQNSEPVTAVLVKVGDHVKAGQTLIELDTTNEARALAQAKLSMQSAQLSLAKLVEAPATTTLLQDQNAITQAEANVLNASTTLSKDYQAGFDTLGQSFVDFQNVMAGVQSFVVGNDISKSQSDPDAYVNLMPTYLQVGTKPYRDAVMSAFAAANAAYEQNQLDYHAASRTSDTAKLDALFAETYATSRSVSEAVKSVKDLLNYVVNNYPTSQGLVAQLPAVTNTFQTSMGNYTNTANGDVSNLSGAINAITSDKTAILNAQLTLNENSSTLATLLAGANSLDVQSSQLSIQQQQLSLQTAQQNLANDYVRAPIDGVVSALPSVVGATVPSPAVSLVGQLQVAQVTLNEVDAAKVKVGDKATLVFDALPALSLAGQVIEADPVGTVSQGVVNYNVQVALASPNDQIKPGMSVSANIVTQVNQDVVAVPNAAIVKQGTASYILEPASPLSDVDITASASGGIVLAPAPIRVPVTVGLANNTMTEIASGVNVGDQIVVQTIASVAGNSAATAATGGTSALRALGGGLGGGGFGGGGTGGGVRTTGGAAAGR
jgi:multidrug efflux pump subunit AcrA (membrane-fusion protein)